MPAAIIIRAIIMVVMRSIFSRFSLNFLDLANFSLIITRKPEIASIKLCRASEMIAIELDKSPIATFSPASRKLVKINSQPDLIMILLRSLFIILF